MPCTLSACPTYDADYQGHIGATFRIVAVGSTPGTGIAGAFYSTSKLTSPPYLFIVAKGVCNLTTLVEGANLHDVIQLQEVFDEGFLTLRVINYTEPGHTSSSLRIKGI